jgi:hypothetical protein
MMLTEQTVLLASGGRKAAGRFALGAFLVALIFVGTLVVFGQVISLPQEPKLDATLDIVLGAVLIGLAVLLEAGGRFLKKRKPARQKKTRSGLGPRQAFGFGLFSMSTNLTTLVLLVPAAKLVAGGGNPLIESVALVLLLAALAATPAWLPVALAELAPGAARTGLGWLSAMISRYGRQLTTALIGGLGLLLLLRGVFSKLGL